MPSKGGGGPFTDVKAASSSHSKLWIQTEQGQWTAGQVPLRQTARTQLDSNPLGTSFENQEKPWETFNYFFLGGRVRLSGVDLERDALEHRWSHGTKGTPPPHRAGPRRHRRLMAGSSGAGTRRTGAAAGAPSPPLGAVRVRQPDPCTSPAGPPD